MLSLERCREILGEDAPADERQLEKARDDAYRLARLLLEIYREEKAKRREAELAEDPEL
ncbi:MAG TPA: hypothetical protein VN493_26045 [Thermoanaerobaculia bacterium]|nr:hypothetical protein [Thermoanaerobaculia bacterium]